MNKYALGMVLALSGVAFSPLCHAQWDSLINAAKNKATHEIERSMNGDRARPEHVDDQHRSRRLVINSRFDFVPGDKPLYRDDFSATQEGRMPRGWKTNGSGQIVTVQGMTGKWLALQNWATYKISRRQLRLPLHFTLQFDIVAAADQVSDLGQVVFGFAKNDSVRSYMMDAYNDGAINAVGLEYMNRDKATVSSSATGYHHAFNFDLENYGNRIMHVSIAVNGPQMKVYLGHTKVADTRLFQHNLSRYFFVSAPLRSQHGGQVLIGNVRVDGFNASHAHRQGSGVSP